MRNLINSKWTSVDKVEGWRHFEVVDVIKKDKTLKLMSVCNQSVNFIVSFQEINNSSKWLPGWHQIV